MLNDGTEAVKITLHPQCNDTEYTNILIERLQSCGFAVEINWKGSHFYKNQKLFFNLVSSPHKLTTYLPTMTKPIIEYDANGKVIFYENSLGIKEWLDSDGNLTRLINPNAEDGFEEIHYNSKGVEIYTRDSDGYERWSEYDSNGNETHYKTPSGYEQWCEYDSNGNRTHYRNSNGYERWWEHDSNGKLTYHKDSNGFEYWSEYDSSGNKTHYRDSDGYETWYDSNGNVIENPNIMQTS